MNVENYVSRFENALMAKQCTWSSTSIQMEANNLESKQKVTNHPSCCNIKKKTSNLIYTGTFCLLHIGGCYVSFYGFSLFYLKRKW